MINRIYHLSRMQTVELQPKGKRIMPEMRLTSLPALYVDKRVGISQSAFDTDFSLLFLPTKIKVTIYHSSFIFDITTFSEHRAVYFVVPDK